MERHDGFTFVELSVLIALCILVAAITMSHSYSIRRSYARLEIEKLAIICRTLQSMALMSGTTQELVFDQIHSSYHYGTVNERLATGVVFGVIKGTQGPPSHPHRPVDNPVSFDRNRIVFHANGIIQSGTVYLMSRDTKIMYALSSAVSPISYLRIYRFESSWRILS